MAALAHPRVRPVHRVVDPDRATWDDAADVVVVGFGGAGAVAALEAREQGADVVVLDRFGGGGATAISGGVVYAGDTHIQREAGITDSRDAMRAYLALEVGDAVAPETLDRFCDESPANLRWLHDHGVPFEASLCPHKTSYPPKQYCLYYSGNEAMPGYTEVAPPAPRGHRPRGTGLPGAHLWRPIAEAARRRGARVHTQAPVRQLVVAEDGTVVGVVARAVQGTFWRAAHRLAWRVGLAVRNYLPRLQKRLTGLCTRIEERHGRPWRIRARRGVVLATGGFIHHREMVRALAPAYRPGMPLGTPGCDGSGIVLGTTAEAATDRLDRVSAWRFLNPPEAWVHGVFVDRQGERYCNEAVYGAKLGYHMVEEHDGQGILILDDALLRQAFRQLGPGKTQWFQTAPGWLNMLANRRTAPTIRELAQRIGAPPDTLEATLTAYNQAIADGAPDPLAKPDAFRTAMPAGPYHAMDCGLASKRFPCPTLTLGGLQVDEATGAVRRADGTPIPGLYAAGRTAVGVSSGLYVSGLSIADCVFSGRRAGRSVAG